METTIDGIDVTLEGDTLTVNGETINVSDLRGKMNMSTYTAIKGKIETAAWLIDADAVITWVRENLK